MCEDVERSTVLAVEDINLPMIASPNDDSAVLAESNLLRHAFAMVEADSVGAGGTRGVQPIKLEAVDTVFNNKQPLLRENRRMCSGLGQKRSNRDNKTNTYMNLWSLLWLFIVPFPTSTIALSISLSAPSDTESDPGTHTRPLT